MPATALPDTTTRPTDRRLAEAVSARVGAARFNLWFQGHARFACLGDEVVVAARRAGTQEWLEHTFGPAVQEAAEAVCGKNTRVRWVVDAGLFEEGARGEGQGASEEATRPTQPVNPDLERRENPAKKASPKRTAAGTPPAPCPLPLAPSPTDLFGDPLPAPKPKVRRPHPDAEDFARPAAPRNGRRWKGLSDFVIGPSNRVAFASAMSAVEEPGQGANPLVFFGPVGTGKTHLLEGIYAGMRRKSSDARPCYVTAEEFTNRFVQAMRLGKLSAFRRQFRECSALLLDNLNFLATKRATQEEFLHTFDALVADGRQVVVTTDCHPRLADELMPELADRLLGGAVWGLLPPDPDTRLDILRKKASEAPANPIPDAVLKYLSTTLRGNVRELEGAVNSVRHYARVTGRPVDLSLVREALGDLLRHAVRVVTVADVDAAVCAVLRLNQGTLQSKGRSWAVSHPRMLAIYLCRKHTAATYGEISKHFGAKTHSTAVAAEKKVRQWLEKGMSLALGDREWAAKELVDRIERELQR